MSEVRTRLDELLARVEAASGADRAIDGHLAVLLRALIAQETK